MKTGLILFLFPLCLLNGILKAQEIVLDDFSSSQLNSRWQYSSNTFKLSVNNGILQIDYNRTTSSGEWDQFNFNVDDLPLAAYSYLIRIKSNVNTTLTLKPIYGDGSNDWLQVNLVNDNLWHDIELKSHAYTERILEHIYFYLDGGSTQPISGVVYMDYIKILPVSFDAFLQKAIDNAWLLHDHATEGIEEGQFEPGSKSEYQVAIQIAEGVVAKKALSIQEVLDAIKTLNDGTYEFESKVAFHEAMEKYHLAIPNLTFETRNMYVNLMHIGKDSLLFGMQDATGYGVGWSNDNDRSDVKDVCGSYPAVGSWSIKGVASGNDFSNEEYRMSKFFNLGGINTVEWHMDNPYGGNFYWDDRTVDKNVVASLIPEGENHDFYKEQLDNMIFYLRNLKGVRGQSIPIIFRPFHEHNGDWFWWGQAHCSTGEYKELWRFTVEYFIQNKVNNVLFAYSPDRFYTEDGYLERYPGNDYIDILGFDDYWDVSNSFGRDLFLDQLRKLVRLAEYRRKIPALTETGLEGIGISNWFTDILWNPIKKDTLARRIAYAAVWRNANETHHFGPYPGHPVVPDFIDFYNDPLTVFIDDMPDIYSKMLPEKPFITGTDETVFVSNVVLYPNPAIDRFYIKTDIQIEKIVLYNSIGQQFEMKTDDSFGETCIDISSLPRGPYVVKITSDQRPMVTKRLIIW